MTILSPFGRTLPALAAALLGLVPASGCAKSAGPQGPGGVPVKLQVAEDATVDDASEYVATLKSRESAVIMPQVEGHITAISVKAGERVSAGTPLIEIDPAKQQATVKSQEDVLAARRAALAWAKQQHERASGLAAQGISSQADLDQAKAALDAAQAELQAAEAQVSEQQVELHYYTIRAPRDGIVGDVPVRVGDRVTVSTQLTTVDTPGALEAYISVPVERAPQLHPGMPVRIVDATGAVAADSQVTFISPQVDDPTQTILVKARIENAKGTLRPSQFIRARVVWGTRKAPLVPVLAITRVGGQSFAFVAENRDGALVARQRPLKIGEIVGNDYVVLDGIKPGERMIVSGTQFLQDGAPVSPQT
jgi:RND family efflux transporter MFP subunit